MKSAWDSMGWHGIGVNFKWQSADCGLWMIHPQGRAEDEKQFWVVKQQMDVGVEASVIESYEFYLPT